MKKKVGLESSPENGARCEELTFEMTEKKIIYCRILVG
jgi:hypothetical protein